MAFDLGALIVNIIVNIIILAPVLWLSGRLLVGKEKAKFTDAIWIVVLGTLVGAIFGYFFSGWVAIIIELVLWLLIVKHFFDCGWLKALAISIITVIIFAVIVAILALIGFAFFFF
jgi:NO-binding membrane sensor protein with MHYT domain